MTSAQLDVAAADQIVLGKEIERLAIAYRNEKPERKTVAYLQEKYDELKELWSKFEANDDQIRDNYSELRTHAYFAEDYYTKVKKGYQRINTELSYLLGSVQDNPIIAPESRQIGASTSANTSAGSAAQVNNAENNDGRDYDAAKKLIRRQGITLVALNNILSGIVMDGSKSKQYYGLKIDTIRHYWRQIEELNNSIVESCEKYEAIGYDINEYCQMENRIQDVLIDLSQEQDKAASIAPSGSERSSPSSVSHLKLPKITLPKFDGDYLKWQQFCDLYTQMVHNQIMGNSQKMWYLKTNLTGEAEKLIRHLPLTDDNYTTAWEILKNRYENKRLLVTALLDKLMAQPSIHNESASAIKALHDTTKECILSLQNMGLSVQDYWDPIIVHILMKKLDKNTHALYEQQLASPRDLQSINKLLDFLEKRFQALESLGKQQNPGKYQYKPSKPSVFMTNKGNNKLECVMCNKNHPVYFCEVFLKLSAQERQRKASELNLCLNCLKRGHTHNKCTSRGCLKCNKKHNTLLHFPENKNTMKSNENSTNNTNQIATNLAAQAKDNQGGYVFLGTALANIEDQDGSHIPCRILLDSGSQLNFMTERLRKKLKGANTHVNLTISGIGDSKVKVTDRLNITIKSKWSNYSTQLEVYLIKEISANQPQKYINTDGWQIPQNISLADPEFNKPQKIDILLGAEVYGELMRNGQMRLAEKLPMLQNTALGWIVLGKVSTTEYNNPFCGITNLELQNQLQKFWETEECPTKLIMSVNDKKCEDYFAATTFRNKEGRFVVNLPMLSEARLLGESKDMAFRRFLSIEKRLSKDPSLRAQYCEFLDEYLKLGHMQELNPRDLTTPHCFLPHHFVLKPSSSSTRLRVVFDASAKTTSNLSLNDLLLTGPKIQDDLISILLRFRMKKYAVTADIEKMYRQILVATEDQKLQLIMWRTSPEDPIKYYRLCTVTYGTKSAPYLAVKCLKKLAEEDEHKYPLAASAINDFYVDDVMTGSDDLEEAITMQTQLQSMLKGAGFKLRKWCANHPKLVKNIAKEDLAIELDFAKFNNDHVKTLGLVWHPITDLFAITATTKSYNTITKRTILAEVSQLFDPLGLISPVIVKSKIFIQDLWKEKYDWDDELPMEFHLKWLKFRQELNKLSEIKIPRYMLGEGLTSKMQLHAFADASKDAYGTALYIRSKDSKGQATVRLLCAKSRVAPVKPTTIARLELCAANLAAQLVAYVKNVLNVEFEDTFYWTDSEIVISWIRGDPSRLKTYVANRVGAILEVTDPKAWRYVNTLENPADLVSRGVFPEQLVASKLWFKGPEFLRLTMTNWPRSTYKEVRVKEEEKITKISLTAANVTNEHPMYHINHGNSFRKLQRIMAFIIRAIKLFKAKACCSAPEQHLTVSELREAENIIIREVQAAAFKVDIMELRKNNKVLSSSKLASLVPFVDQQGLLRVGGRLQKANISYDTKHPLLLPADSFVSRLLMTYIHNTNLHAGPQALHSFTRQKYWVLQGRNIARSIISNCVVCAKVKPRLGIQQMGNLPTHRIQRARPFLNCGIDFCGPVYTHFKIRGKRPQKSYIAVFCCFATKAIHLEVCSDLTTEGFLGSLKRFIARRGICENIYCDNAKNFVGAKNQLQEVERIMSDGKSREKIANICTEKKIQFHFIPPRSPHFGGLWEAAVKSTKYLLHRTLLTMSPTYEELCTITTEIEAILNSRPLTPLSSDPNDLAALTPAHFLIGEPMNSTINTHTDTKMSLSSRWALVSHVRNEFWRRWSQEYLIELQKRAKWTKEHPNMKPGTLVLIKEENLPPLRWSMGKIEEVIQGHDGRIRVADVRTATGIFRRTIHQLAPLPVDLSTNETEIPEKMEEEQVEMDTEHTSATNHQRSRKRKGLSAADAALKVLLLSTLVLPVFTEPTVHSDPIQIQEFTHNAGIYFEHLGKGSVTSDSWDILAFYDLTGYWATVAIIKSGLMQLKGLCRIITNNDYYVETTSQYQHQFKQIENNNFLLGNAEAKTSRPRKRRSPLDIIGTIANKLFGILDSNYEAEMAETITKVKSNEDHLNDIIKKQTSILETTVNIIKRSEEDRANQTEAINQALEYAYDKMRNMSSEMKQQKVIQTFNTLSILISALINECRFTQEAILDVIADTHHGRVNPLVISPSQLQAQISVIKENLPSGTWLPLINGKLDIQLIYNLMTVHCKTVDKYVVFGITIPLVVSTKFEVYKITPLPTLINSSFVSVAPKMQYLLTNIYKDQFYLMEQLEYMNCLHVKEDNILCQQYRPIVSKDTANRSCEIQLFLQRTVPTTCPIEVTSPTKIWIQLRTRNHWIYSLDKEYELAFLCNNNLIHKTLKACGILMMNSGCTMKDNDLTITATNKLQTQISLNSFQPRLNFTLELDVSNTMDDSMPTLRHSNLALPNRALANLTNEIKQLKARQINLQDLQPSSVQQTTINYTTMAIVSFIIVYLVLVRVRIRAKAVNVHPMPIPAPRTTPNPVQPTDYSFEVE